MDRKMTQNNGAGTGYLVAVMLALALGFGYVIVDGANKCPQDIAAGIAGECPASK